MAIRSPERAWARARVAAQIRARKASSPRRAWCRRPPSPSSRATVACRSPALPVEADQPVPAEENVAGGLHQALPGDDALAAVGVLALADEAFQHRFLGFLRLQEQRVLVVSSEHQQNPGAGADTADSDDLAGHVGVVEVLKQVPPVGLQGAPVAPDDAADLSFDLVAFSSRRQQVLDRDDQWGVGDDSAFAVDLAG